VAGIITLLSDFGLRDWYVASMKGIILGIFPGARLVDISHQMDPLDIRSAAFVLFSCYSCFPPGTIHLAVVDPGVGTERRAIAVRTSSGVFVGPDNGIFSIVLQKEPVLEARSIENADFQRKPISATFHGRDIFAPAAANLAAGLSLERLGPSCTPAISEWASPLITGEGIEGEVIHIDRFGNAITNVAGDALGGQVALARWRVRAGEAHGLPIIDTYGVAPPGSAVALIGSSGFFEIAISRGNAASKLGLNTGSRVFFQRPGAQ